MAAVTLHIGTMKTGTTFLQSWLWENQDKLRQAGWQYPDFLGRKNHSKLAAPYVWFDDSPVQFGSTDVESRVAATERLAYEFATRVKPDDHWIISSERLTQVLTTNQQVQSLHQLLGQFFDSIQAVVYFRRQEFMALSSYSQSIRNGGSLAWGNDYIDACAVLLNYEYCLSTWASVLGAQAVVCRPYLEKYKSGGDELLTDFVAATGLPERDDWSPARPKSRNTGLSAEGISLVLTLDRHDATEDSKIGELLSRYEALAAREPRAARTARKLLAADVAALVPGKPAEFDAEMLGHIQGSFHESNLRFIKELGGGQEWQEWLNQPSPECVPAQPPEISPARVDELVSALLARVRV